MNYRNVKIDKSSKNREAVRNHRRCNHWPGQLRPVLQPSSAEMTPPSSSAQETNIQENCTIHVSRDLPVHIGNNVTIGHNAVIHGCTIGDRTLIGMGTIILDGAEIGTDCIIGAGKPCHQEYCNSRRFPGNGKPRED